MEVWDLTPQEAKPENNILSLLKKISKSERNEVVIISGRDRVVLEEWFGDLNISLVAEHGAWIKDKGDKSWQVIEPLRSGTLLL